MSILSLLSLCLLSTCALSLTRIRTRKHFSIDDGVLVFTIGCLVPATITFLTFGHKLYLLEAAESRTPGLELQPDILDQAIALQKFAAIGLMLTWSSVIAVNARLLTQSNGSRCCW